MAIRRTVAALVLCLAAALLGVASSSSSSSSPFEASLHAVGDASAPRTAAATPHACDEPWCLVVQLRNPSASAADVAHGSAPLGGVDAARHVTVRREADGAALPYQGAVVKRRAGTEQVEAGGERSAVVDLALGYELLEGVAYVASYGGAELRFTPRASSGLPVEHHQRLVSGEGEGAPRRVSPLFSEAGSCTSSWSNTAAISAAITGLRSANTTFFPRSCQGTSYTNWFGTVSTTRYCKVRGNYARILAKFEASTFIVHCNGGQCSANIFAYVFPNDSAFTIYVCGAYLSANTAFGSGFDTKAGTMVHEMSHFTVIADTDDVAYGYSNLRTLANSNPDNAVRNADSHEYFLEDEPTLCAVSDFTAISCPSSGGGDSSDTCSTSTTCSACTGRGSCGWCGSNSVCYTSNSDGPLAYSCPSGYYAWTSNTCSAANAGTSGSTGGGSTGGGDDDDDDDADECNSSTSCEACTDRAACGWCGSNSVCYTSNSRGPQAYSCPSGYFAYFTSTCSAANAGSSGSTGGAGNGGAGGDDDNDKSAVGAALGVIAAVGLLGALVVLSCRKGPKPAPSVLASSAAAAPVQPPAQAQAGQLYPVVQPRN